MIYQFQQSNIPYYNEIMKLFGEEMQGIINLTISVNGTNISRVQVSSDESPKEFQYDVFHSQNNLTLFAQAIDVSAKKMNYGTLQCAVVIAQGIPQGWRITKVRSIRLKDATGETKKEDKQA